MVIAGSNLVTNDTETSDWTATSTASFSITANRLVLVGIAIMSDSSDTPEQPTLAGFGMTWTFVNSAAHDISGQKATLFVFRGLDASPSPNPDTLDFSVVTTMEGACTVVDEFSGIDTTTPTLQSATNVSGGNDTALTVQMSGLTNSANAVYCAWGIDDDQAITPESGFIKLGESQNGSDSDTSMSMWKLTPQDNSPSCTIGDSEHIGGVAIEIKDAGAPAATSEVPQMALKGVG